MRVLLLRRVGLTEWRCLICNQHVNESNWSVCQWECLSEDRQQVSKGIWYPDSWRTWPVRDSSIHWVRCWWKQVMLPIKPSSYWCFSLSPTFWEHRVMLETVNRRTLTNYELRARNRETKEGTNQQDYTCTCVCDESTKQTGWLKGKSLLD